MENPIFLLIPLSLLALPLLGNALSDCSGPCKTLNDCSGQLICINSKCNDDPDVGTTICKGGSTPSPTPPNDALSNCSGPCKTLNDCFGQLICINGKCNDDPDVGTTICKGGRTPSPTPPNDDLSDCSGPCKTLNDCYGQLICINGKCNDDPDIGTTNCKGVSTPSPTPPNSCKPAGTLICEGNTYPTYNCSPQVTAATSARLTLNYFNEGGHGGGPSECNEKYHPNTERLVALSTGWYDGGSRCGKMIRIKASNGRSVTARVVDKCDSMNGCDEQSAGLGPCKNNIVDGLAAVWNSLGLNRSDGVVNVTWSMAETDLMVCKLRHTNLVVCQLRQLSYLGF